MQALESVLFTRWQRQKKGIVQKREKSQGTSRQGEHEMEQAFETHQSCKLLLDGSHRFIEHGNSLKTEESAGGETVHLWSVATDVIYHMCTCLRLFPRDLSWQ